MQSFQTKFSWNLFSIENQLILSYSIQFVDIMRWKEEKKTETIRLYPKEWMLSAYSMKALPCAKMRQRIFNHVNVLRVYGFLSRI